MKNIGIVILHYGSPQVTGLCVKSVLNSLGAEFHILVLDNNSPEAFEFSEADPRLTVIRLDENVGFSGGVNRGLAFLKEKKTSTHFLILNNDTIIQTDTLQKLLAYEQELSGIVSPLIYDYKGENPSEFGGRLNEFTFFFYEQKPPLEKITRLDFIPAACILFSRETYERIGEWDERFFMYAEDMDYCIRAGRLNIPISLVSDAKVNHIKGGSSGGVAPFAIYYIHRNRFLLAYKYLSPLKLVGFFIFYGNMMFLKLLKWSLKNRALVKWFLLGYLDGVLKREGKSKRLF